MNLANKYMMRSSGESIHQANGYSESVAMGVIDTLQNSMLFSIGVAKLIDNNKDNLTKLDELMQYLVTSINKNNRIYEDLKTVIRVLKSCPEIKPLFITAPLEDIESLYSDLVAVIEISRPVVATPDNDNKNIFASFLKLAFNR